MRVLLDESVPRALADFLEGHEVTTVQRHGWQSTANGELLRLASSEFDVFVTADQNLEHQQNLRAFNIGVVVLAADRNRIESYLPVRDGFLEAVEAVASGTAIVVIA